MLRPVAVLLAFTALAVGYRATAANSTAQGPADVAVRVQSRHLIVRKTMRRVSPHARPVPILAYHVIGIRPQGAPFEGLWVTPAELTAQVRWLATNGWHTVTLGAVARYWRKGDSLPPRPVVLSFDDGYAGDWLYALPILRANRDVGVLNLQIGNIAPFHVRSLIAAGWEIDSHTFTHPDLRTLTAARLQHEVLDSRFWLQREFHAVSPAFCYPFGRYDARVVAVVRRAGYALAETENQGWASPRDGLLTLRRISILPTTSIINLAGFLAKPPTSN